MFGCHGNPHKERNRLTLTTAIYFGAKRRPVLFIILYITKLKNGTTALCSLNTLYKHTILAHTYCISIYIYIYIYKKSSLLIVNNFSLQPPKKKGGGGGKGGKKKSEGYVADGVSTTEMTREQLEVFTNRLREEMEREREERNFFQLERDKLRTFWEITRQQLEESRAELRSV